MPTGVSGKKVVAMATTTKAPSCQCSVGVWSDGCTKVLAQGCLWRIPKRGLATAPPLGDSPRRGSLAYARLGRGALPLTHAGPMGSSFGSYEVGFPPYDWTRMVGRSPG